MNKTENKKLDVIYYDIYKILSKNNRDIYFGLFLIIFGFLILAIFKKWMNTLLKINNY